MTELDRLKRIYAEWDDRANAAGISKDASMFAVMTHWGKTLDLADALRALIDEVEWEGGSAIACPWCGHYERKDGHATNCRAFGQK